MANDTIQYWFDRGYSDYADDTQLSSDELSSLSRNQRESYLEGYFRAANDDAELPNLTNSTVED